MHKSPRRRRVAIIDDDVAVISLLCQIFAEQGWAAIPWPHGASALSMLEASRPGVVLLDIRLDTPDRGWEILRQLRRTDWGRSLPVVLCSAGAALTDWPDDLDRDGIEEVSKPFELDDLVTVLARCLERAPSRTSKLGARR